MFYAILLFGYFFYKTSESEYCLSQIFSRGPTKRFAKTEAMHSNAIYLIAKIVNLLLSRPNISNRRILAYVGSL